MPSVQNSCRSAQRNGLPGCQPSRVTKKRQSRVACGAVALNTKVNLPLASAWIGVVCQSLRFTSGPRKVGLLPLHSLPSGTTA